MLIEFRITDADKKTSLAIINTDTIVMVLPTIDKLKTTVYMRHPKADFVVLDISYDNFIKRLNDISVSCVQEKHPEPSFSVWRINP